MKIWLISQTENNGYDTYDSAVVAAETSEEAKRIGPDGSSKWSLRTEPGDDSPSWGWFGNGRGSETSWAISLEAVSVKYIGEAGAGTGKGVILASFNAG